MLCAVFVPCAFISGITGQFFRQFALTIAVSTVISAFNSLTLSPALARHAAASRTAPQHDPLTVAARLRCSAGSSGCSTAASAVRPNVYTRVVGMLLRVSVIVLLVYGGLLVSDLLELHAACPTGFIPDQDKGYLLVNVQLPDAASLERTAGGDARGSRRSPATTDGRRAHAWRIAGPVVPAERQRLELRLDVRHPRRRSTSGTAPELCGRRHRRRAPRASCRSEIHEAMVGVFGAPPVDGLGNAGGFKLMVEDRGDLGLETLQDAGRQRSSTRATQHARPGRPVHQLPRQHAVAVSSTSTAPRPSRWAWRSSDVFDTLQVYLGSLYVNDFNQFGRTWQVNVQADASFRMQLDDVQQLQGPQRQGRDGAAGHAGRRRATSSGPVMIMRYNMYPAAAINGNIAARRQLRARPSPRWKDWPTTELPPSMGFEWTELTLPADPGRQHGACSSSRWPWCSCSSCWPRSTKAGRCRWR